MKSLLRITVSYYFEGKIFEIILWNKPQITQTFAFDLAISRNFLKFFLNFLTIPGTKISNYFPRRIQKSHNRRKKHNFASKECLGLNFASTYHLTSPLAKEIPQSPPKAKGLHKKISRSEPGENSLIPSQKEVPKKLGLNLGQNCTQNYGIGAPPNKLSSLKINKNERQRDPQQRKQRV